jgi:excisionase family DNA binding protein
MSSEYYTLEKAAEVLGLPTAEVNRLREKNELRAFRDGASWKFRKTEVDNMLAEIIKKRNKQQNIGDDSALINTSGNEISDDDFDLLVDGELVELSAGDEVQDTDAFDTAMENGFEFEEELIDGPIAKDDVEVVPIPTSDLPEVNKIVDETSINVAVKSEKIDDDNVAFSLAKDNDDLVLAKDNDELVSVEGNDDLVLADDQVGANVSESVAAGVIGGEQREEDELVFAAADLSLSDDDGLMLLEDSGDSGLSLDKRADALAVSDSGEELDDDLLKSFSEETGSGNDNNSVGGLDNVSSDADDEILFELEDSDDVAAKPAEKSKESVIFEQLSDDDDFLELINDDTPSEFITAGEAADDFNLLPDDLGLDDDSESASQIIPLDDKNLPDPIFGDISSPSSSFGDSPFQPSGNFEISGEFTPQIHSTSGIAYQQEVQFSPLMVGSFIAAAVLLILPSVMLLDLISNIWGWNESLMVNSPILSAIESLIGSKK